MVVVACGCQQTLLLALCEVSHPLAAVCQNKVTVLEDGIPSKMGVCLRPGGSPKLGWYRLGDLKTHRPGNACRLLAHRTSEPGPRLRLNRVGPAPLTPPSYVVRMFQIHWHGPEESCNSEPNEAPVDKERCGRSAGLAAQTVAPDTIGRLR